MLKAELNNIPGQVRSIHMIAVCGTGMGALACILKELGFKVTGSDANVYPPMSTFLQDKGIEIFKGFSASHLNHRPDLVVVGNAVSKDNPEVVALADLNLPYCSMPQAICHFFSSRRQIMVSGTHGKTTTSALIAWILHRAGLDPGFFIGGIVGGFNSNYRLGRGRWLVLEGDEYDTAFFDKEPKFLHFNPEISVITSLEFDHADIYKDLDAVEQAFRKLVAGIDSRSTIMACDRAPLLGKVLEDASCKVESYGRGENAFWQARKMVQSGPQMEFSLFRRGKFVRDFVCPLVGYHNLENVTAALAVAHKLGISPDSMARALAAFPGVARRQQIRGEKHGIMVMDDFAHHPTAVKATIEAVAGSFPQRRLIAVFEPRTNSNRRRVFQDVYPDAFGSAGIVCVRRPPAIETVAPEDRFSVSRLVKDLRHRGIDAHRFGDTDSIIAFLKKLARAGDLILIMSNGGFDNIHSRLLDVL